MIIDTHAHLTWGDFKEDLPAVLQRCQKAGVEIVINIGADLESSTKAAKLDCNPLKSYSSIGIHPHEVSRLSNDVSIHENIKKLEEIYHSHSEKIVAVGECGLDYHFAGLDFSGESPFSEEEMKVLQKKIFIAQIDLAKKLNLPLIIHCREAWDDIFIPHLSGTRGVFHSFTGTAEQAQKVLDLGFYLGFTCIVTYPKNEILREIIKSTPLNKILVETDCPYLPPQSMRGQRNEPANVLEVIKVIAQAKNISIETTSNTTSQNACKLFGLGYN